MGRRGPNLDKLSGREACQGCASCRKARTREFGAEKAKRVREGIGFAGQRACSAPGPRNEGRIAGATSKDACKGGNPSRTFTVVSVSRQVGLNPPFPHPLFFCAKSFGGCPAPIKEQPPGSCVVYCLLVKLGGGTWGVM